MPDKTMPGPDHKASLEPMELKAMVDAIRNIEQALGNGEKHVSPSERPNIVVARKSIVAAREIRKGELFTEENITVNVPSDYKKVTSEDAPGVVVWTNAEEQA